jgi:glycosyltransferase involved in cell wall biosynthesis
VGNGCNGLAEAKLMAERCGVSDMIEWSEFIWGDDVVAAYQRSKACLVPFTSGSGRQPVTCAMASGIPVIGTRSVDIPEYLGDLGIYVEPNGQSIADAVLRIERASAAEIDKGASLRLKAIAELDYDGIAEEVNSLYSHFRPKMDPTVSTKLA